MPKRSPSQLFSSQGYGPTVVLRSTKRFKSGGTPAYKANTVAAKTQRRVELKRVSDETVISNLTTAGAVVPFPIPEAGDSEVERDGRVIEHRGYQMTFHYVPSNLLDYEKLRVVLILWKGLPTVPTIQDLLDVSSWANVFGQYNIKNAANIEVIKDVIYDVNTQGGLTAASTTFCRNVVLANWTGTKRFQQSFRTTFADLTEGNGSALFAVFIPLVGGGATSIVKSSTFVDV